jgi:hypothetical protein
MSPSVSAAKMLVMSSMATHFQNPHRFIQDGESAIIEDSTIMDDNVNSSHHHPMKSVSRGKTPHLYPIKENNASYPIMVKEEPAVISVNIIPPEDRHKNLQKYKKHALATDTYETPRLNSGDNPRFTFRSYLQVYVNAMHSRKAMPSEGKLRSASPWYAVQTDAVLKDQNGHVLASQRRWSAGHGDKKRSLDDGPKGSPMQPHSAHLGTAASHRSNHASKRPHSAYPALGTTASRPERSSANFHDHHHRNNQHLSGTCTADSDNSDDHDILRMHDLDKHVQPANRDGAKCGANAIPRSGLGSDGVVRVHGDEGDAFTTSDAEDDGAAEFSRSSSPLSAPGEHQPDEAANLRAHVQMRGLRSLLLHALMVVNDSGNIIIDNVPKHALL